MMYLIMRSGQTPDAKETFYKRVVENLSRNPGIDPANVLITIAENDLEVIPGWCRAVRSRSVSFPDASCSEQFVVGVQGSAR
ncbi:MAG: tautomerase family protein [Acidobacteriaceae bacterium]|nr:tautomerase family protein [Acidobacteriaceae bacterium]